jgi:hypothetical protein
MEKLSLELTKLLYMRFTSTYGEKFVKNHPNDEFVKLWWEEWSEGMAGIDPAYIREALSYCRLNLEWPPSIAEFRRICEKASGIPSCDEALNAAIRREFDHPVIKLAYDKVGSWAMKNDKQTDLKPKFSAAYQDALNYFRQNQQQAWQQLEEFNAKPKELPLLSKIPTIEECKGFRQRFAEYQEMAKAEKEKLPSQEHPIWPKEKITKGAKSYDEAIYQERKRYLLSCNEFIASTLSKEDWYDRTRFMREIEGYNSIKDSTPCDDTNNKKNAPRSFYGAKAVYDRWNN